MSFSIYTSRKKFSSTTVLEWTGNCPRMSNKKLSNSQGSPIIVLKNSNSSVNHSWSNSVPHTYSTPNTIPFPVSRTLRWFSKLPGSGLRSRRQRASLKRCSTPALKHSKIFSIPETLRMKGCCSIEKCFTNIFSMAKVASRWWTWSKYIYSVIEQWGRIFQPTSHRGWWRAETSNLHFLLKYC